MPKSGTIKSDLKAQIPEETRRAAKEISGLPGVLAVYLFGSYAKGTQRPYSDVDLCIMAENLDAKTVGDILMHSSKRIETHILDALPLNIQFRVFSEGKPLFVNSGEKILEKRLAVMRLYQDFRPRLERYWRNILS